MALLETRPCWQCGYCHTVVCPESAASAGVRVLGDSARQCPVCARPLLAAVMDDRYRLETCPQCKGILLGLPVFAATVMGKRHAAATPLRAPTPADDRELQRRVACPSCQIQMITDWYYGPGNIVIDRCETCALVWLDAGELQRAIEAPGPDRPA